MVYADDIMLGVSINTIRKNIEAFLEASRKVGVQVNTETIKSMVMCCHKM